MNKEIEIPKGYEARVEGNKVIFVPKESEDERIRKEIIGYLNNRVATAEETELLYFKRWIAYLEKQKEQKPDIELIKRSWYIEGYHDRKYCKESKWIIKTGEEGPKYEENPKYGQPLTDEQKPAEWSEKDERNLYNTIEAIKYSYDVSAGSGGLLLINWLKYCLRHRFYWKPSKEQMEALIWQIKNTSEGSWQRRESENLYNELKKLYGSDKLTVE